jgi:chromosome segregation ATPase
MDPLSIVGGVVGLLKACGVVSLSLKELYEGAQAADAKAQALKDEIGELTLALELIRSTMEDRKMQLAFQSTGHIGNHWRSIVVCLEDGQKSLAKLQTVVNDASKTVKHLDKTRKHLRLQSAADEIATYHQRVRTCRETLQLSIQVVIM